MHDVGGRGTGGNFAELVGGHWVQVGMHSHLPFDCLAPCLRRLRHEAQPLSLHEAVPQAGVSNWRAGWSQPKKARCARCPQHLGREPREPSVFGARCGAASTSATPAPERASEDCLAFMAVTGDVSRVSHREHALCQEGRLLGVRCVSLFVRCTTKACTGRCFTAYLSNHWHQFS